MQGAKTIKSIYGQREKFVLIGLTGRTGSGCTTVSKILAKKNISELDLRSYKTCDYNSSDERKYSVVYRFLKAGSRWKEFVIIEASSIIFSFILQGTYGQLFDFFQGAIGNAYISLYAPRMPYKDEIQLITNVKIKDEAANVYKKYNSLYDK